MKIRQSDQSTCDFTLGSGNIFADLDVPEAEEERLKAELARSIRRILEREGLNQTQAARLMHTRQSRVSEILGGKLEHFTSDRLFRFMRYLRVPITVTLHESQVGQRAAGVTVTTE